MDSSTNVLNFFKWVSVVTAYQLVLLLGVMFIFGLILYLLARFTRRVYAKTLGPKFEIFFTGWIGTPVHELGHAFFCAIFRHKILKVKLFEPNSSDGTMGYVSHSFNQKSIYQQIGNLFIGFGPIIFGAIILFVAMYYLVPSSNEVISSLEKQSEIKWNGTRGDIINLFVSQWASIKSTLQALFQSNNFPQISFWIFIFISIAIASHMELSPSDIKSFWGGLLALTLFLFVINSLTLLIEKLGFSNIFGEYWTYIKIDSHSSIINKWTGILSSILILSTVISGVNFLASFILLSIVNLFRGKGFVNPIW